MLPILKRLKEGSATGILVKERQPDAPQNEPSEDNDSSAIEECASEILRAIKANDHKGLADALQDVFDILESQPHEEGGHEPHSYDAQNQKASQEQD